MKPDTLVPKRTFSIAPMSKEKPLPSFIQNTSQVHLKESTQGQYQTSQLIDHQPLCIDFLS